MPVRIMARSRTSKETTMDQGRPRLGVGIDYRRLRSDLAALRERLPQVRETAESDDGLIRVTLGAKGELLALDLNPRIYRVPDSAALARDITATVHRAAEAVRERVYALTRSVLSDPDAADPSFDPMLAELDRKARR
jgi:DNA-binding protein YbaB